MIVRDEAETLDRCLDSVAGFVSEIVIVDTGSSDGTRAKAKARGAKLTHLEWKEDFAEARNLALSQATGSWILVLDGDEWIESAPGFEAFADRAATERAFFATILDHLDGGALRTAPQVRIFRNDVEHRYRDAFPEQIVPAIAAREGARWIEPPACDLVIGHDGFRSDRRSGGRTRRMVAMLRRAIQEHRHEPAARYALARERLRMRGLHAVPGARVAEALVHLDWLADHAGVLSKRFEADAARLRASALLAAGLPAEARAAAEPWRGANAIFEALSADAAFEECANDRAGASEAFERFRACFDQDAGRGLPFRQPSLTGAFARARAAEMCIRMGRAKDAERLASEAAGLPGGAAAAAIAVAALRRARGDRAGAVEAYRSAVEADSYDPWGWLGLGELALETGDVAGSVDALTRCAALAEGWPSADEALTAALLVAERSEEIPDLFEKRDEGGGTSGRVAVALAAVAADREPPASGKSPGFDEALSRILRFVESAGKKGLLQKLAAGTRGVARA
jgi:tetratricopeptide (TPR) repeat protein